MEWPTVLGLVIGNAAWITPLFLWVRSESRSDVRHMDNKLEAIREMTHAIHMEVKDFHSRLCEVERKNKGS
jgi:hypothetical protein